MSAFVEKAFWSRGRYVRTGKFGEMTAADGYGI